MKLDEIGMDYETFPDQSLSGAITFVQVSIDFINLIRNWYFNLILSGLFRFLLVLSNHINAYMLLLYCLRCCCF